MKKTYLSLAAIVSASFLAYSCSCTTPKKPVAEAPAPVKQEVQQQAPAPVAQPQVNEEEVMKEIFQRIHFNFDKSNLVHVDKWGINQDVPKSLDGISDYMAKHPDIKVKIEGNCDERGTEAYNLALGQRRADSAKNYLVMHGISADRIETLSNGKLKPVDPAQNEYAWAKNRNDQFVILSK
ncbi:peptidoglycan-associated outer membrane lipoproteinn P6, OmpA/MotB precursor [Desulfurella amilsii]|uniref:Peptidoglycan-associated lipoprotein n=1 Tax=Desulfurella amilsii TaxID=1562698 RepID=A0A1X4XV89_9BACT|nr:OmpA family protein [Desulfurella amilsii]OSS41444.1 peptidoglycan-associated outer membrane lipoproteinn P6, OmpA/MotB precursor [Desulfurella amilsii]